MSGYHELAAKVDGFFSRVAARHGNDMRCGSGCSDCCHVRLTVTAVEAAAIRAEIATWDPARRAALAANVAGAHGDSRRCAALDPEGRCLIYQARPIVCRSHGAPIRMAGPSGRGLPVVESCFRNFTATTPDPDCVLDQTTLSALVLAVNAGDVARDGSRGLARELLGCAPMSIRRARSSRVREGRARGLHPACRRGLHDAPLPMHDTGTLKLDACCQYGCDVDLFETRRDPRARRRRSARCCRAEARDLPWFDEREPETDPDVPSGTVIRTATFGDGCVFLAHDRRGCAIHRASIEQGWDFRGTKPAVCRLFPLTYGDGAIFVSDDYPDYSCAHDDTAPTLYRVTREALADLFGAALVVAMDAAETRVLARRLPLVTPAPSPGRARDMK